jgi:hypothetical protein
VTKGTIITIALALAAVLGGIGLFFSYVSFRQDCVSYETAIAAQDKEMQNVDTKLTNSLKTQGLAVNEYKSLVIDAFKAANSGRYGQDGSKAMLQFIKEQNPNIDASLLKKLMVCAESGYAEFASAQTFKIDKVRAYKTMVEREQQVPLWGAIVTSGFPRKPWEEFERVIVSGDTQKTWATGVKEAVDPFK